MQLNHLPKLKQADYYGSEMFPLNKTDSLENMMQHIASTKNKLIGGSLRSISSPRAKSAHPLGGQRTRSTNNMKPRVESSQAG